MNGRRNKRHREAHNSDMHNMQARQSEPSLQTKPESVPQPKGEAVAPADRTNSKTKGGEMHESLWDKIVEHKRTIIAVIAVIGIAAAMSAIMVSRLAISRARYTTDLAAVQSGLEDVSRQVSSILALGPLATRADLTPIANQARAAVDGVADLRSDMEQTNARIDDLQQHLRDISGAPPEAWLEGTFDEGYTVHAKSSHPGNFMIRVHLYYSQPLAHNGTYEEAQRYFYSAINWTATTPAYITTVAFNGTDWLLTELWWSIGILSLEAGNETIIPATAVGLTQMYATDLAYATIYQLTQ